MSRLKRHRKIRPAAFLVGGAYGRIQPPIEMRADVCYQVPPCGKPQHANPVWINVPPGCVKTHQPHRPLSIFKRRRCLRFHLALTPIIPMHPRIRHAIFQQHTCDPYRRQPAANLRAFQIDDQVLISPAGNTIIAAPVFFPSGEYTVIVA